MLGPGRLPISKETKALIERMATENCWRGRKIQQLRGTFPDEPTHRYLIYDNDAIFSPAVTGAIKGFELDPKRTAFRSLCSHGKTQPSRIGPQVCPAGLTSDSR
jgi:hypothetical protein